ncbi:MAG: N-acetylneuraminate synthase family protein [Deltaproteobacteria bacterium]|nr:N-acetylneuraminate synthase family protein [Deltaproteobacteria bacterium]
MKTAFIAEVSSNHRQNLDRCLDFIDVSAQIGCDAVKFQLFKLDELFAPEIVSRSENHARRRQWELPVAFLPRLRDHCDARQIRLGCTPFYLAAVDALVPYVDFLKISSYEILWQELLAKCAQSGKPIILSTGMATMAEVSEAVGIIKENGCTDLTVLQCVSAYPTPVNECNLNVIDAYRRHFAVKAGWSDHSVSPSVMYRAAFELHADVIEFHLDLDGDGAEYAAGHCWLPHEIALVIRTIKEGYAAGGDGEKRPVSSELSDRDWRADPTDGLRPFKFMRKDWQP